MKTNLKSFSTLLVSAIMILFSSCNRGTGTGCGTWSEIKYKKQYHTQPPKKIKSFASYKEYN